jgi:hypothetical protein
VGGKECERESSTTPAPLAYKKSGRRRRKKGTSFSPFSFRHISWFASWSLQTETDGEGKHEARGEEGEELHSPGMAAAAIGAVVLFLAATSFRANANTDSNDGRFRCSSRRKAFDSAHRKSMHFSWGGGGVRLV